MNLLQDYYSDSHVRRRFVEFLGGPTLDEASAVFVTSHGQGARLWYDPQPVGELGRYLNEGREVARSLWDRHSLIVHLDLEYVNFDRPAEPYLEPTRVFDLQRPVVRALQETFARWGIEPLHLLSGRGHHFVWRIRRDSATCARLSRLGRMSSTLAARYAQPQPPSAEAIEPALGAAFAGLGLVLEYVAHRVLVTASHNSEIPVKLTAVEAPPGARGREVISIDLSEYGDPLHIRSVRMPFSAYLKPQQLRDQLGSEVVDRLPLLFMIPAQGLGDREGLMTMRNPSQVTRLARLTSVAIPEQSEGTARLIAAYSDSSLARFHEFFYGTEHDSPAAWKDTYDRTPLVSLPACARRMLEEPNDLLLKPAAIQHIVRVLMAVGWHPRHVGGLIRSKYERDFGWGEYWFLYDAATRADFYTRLFAGQFAVGLDDLTDFNCRSTREKGYCERVVCNEDLDEYRKQLLARRANHAFEVVDHESLLPERPWEGAAT